MLWATLMLCFAAPAQTLAPVETGRDARRLEINVEVRRPEGWTAVDPSTVFDSGAEIRFRVRSNFPSRLTVSNLASSGLSAILFPSPEAGLDNLLEPGREVVLPGSGASFRIGGPAGFETLYWIATPWSFRTAEQPVYTPLAPPPAHGTRLETLIPRCDDGIFRARGECLDTRAGARKVQPGAPMTDNGGKTGDLRARDLEVVRKPAPAAVRPAGGMQAVIYEMRIAHR